MPNFFAGVLFLKSGLPYEKIKIEQMKESAEAFSKAEEAGSLTLNEN